MPSDPKALEARLKEIMVNTAYGGSITFKAMFGGILAYIDGKPAVSLSDVGMAFKLSKADQPDILKLPGAKMLQYEPDAPMSKEYVVLPQQILDDDQELAQWLERCGIYVKTQPAKKKK